MSVAAAVRDRSARAATNKSRRTSLSAARWNSCRTGGAGRLMPGRFAREVSGQPRSSFHRTHASRNAPTLTAMSAVEGGPGRADPTS
jgi:hypothetical protein